MQNAGFTISGKYLCWQYPDRKVINVLDLQPFNNIRLKQQDILDDFLDNVGYEVAAIGEMALDGITGDDTKGLVYEDGKTAGHSR